MSNNLKLAFVGQHEYFLPMYDEDVDDLYITRRFAAVFDQSSNNEVTPATMPDLMEFDPDVAIFFRVECFSNSLLSRLKGMKIAISTEPFPKYIDDSFHYTSDSIRRFKSFLKIAQLGFDYIFHYDATSLRFLEQMGVRLSGPFMLPVATATWRGEAPSHPDWDVIFVGRSTIHREMHFGPLKRDLRFLHISHGVVGKEALAFYSRSRIGLNVHSEPELAWEPRVQQLMAAGILVVSEPISPNDLLLPGEHYLEVRSPWETYQTCLGILESPEKFEIVRRAGHERVHRELSARKVWPTLIERCLDRDFSKPTFDLAQVRLAPLEICAEFDGFEHLLDQLRVRDA
jgi:hypothetical protein